MDISKEKILELVHNNLSQEQIEGSFIYWNERPFTKDQEIRMGPQRIGAPFDGLIVFVDLSPGFNWAHPCLYLLVNINDFSVETRQASFPPSRQYSETFSLLLKCGKKPVNK